METTVELAYHPLPRQAIAHAAPERYLLYGGAVGGGKSAWLANEAIQLSLEYNGNRGYLCRHELTSFRRTTLLTLLSFLPEGLVSNHQKSEQYFEFVNGSRIYYGGLGEEEGLQRLKSMDLGWFGVDQCEETSEDHFLLLASRLRLRLPDGSRPFYRGLCTANPDPGWPRQRWIEQSLPDHHFIPALPRDNPYLPADYEDKLRELYPADLAAALLDGNWDVMSGVNYLIPIRDINAAATRELEAEGPSSFGIDVARYGDDKTVVIWCKGPVMLRMWQWGKLDLVESETNVKPLIDEFQPGQVNIDEVGVGAGLYDNLRHREDYKAPVSIVGVNGGEAARDNVHYANRRAEEFFGLARRFREGAISILDDRELKAQLAVLKYKINSHGQYQIESKDEIKKRGLPSPDKADALMLSMMGEEGMGKTVMSEAVDYMPGPPSWWRKKY